MKKMLFYILLALALAVLGFVVVVSTRPSDFRITRSETISASPEVIFAKVNDLHQWQSWSPWEKMDPNSKRTYEGPATGVGSSYGWDGNNQVGAGRMTITESRPGELIVMKLEFFRPFAGVNKTEFTFKPQGNQTVVSWTMSGQNNFMGKAFSLFVDCDDMVGKEFAKGLATLKSQSETEGTTAK